MQVKEGDHLIQASQSLQYCLHWERESLARKIIMDSDNDSSNHGKSENKLSSSAPPPAPPLPPPPKIIRAYWKMEQRDKRRSANFEKRWPAIEKAVEKFINLIEDGGASFSIQDYMSIYKYIYDMRNDVDNINPKQLWDNYKKLFARYINSKVFPSLQAKENEVLLRELLKRWSNHKIFTCWISGLFGTLETSIAESTEYSLKKIGFLSFYDLVYKEVNKKVMDAILAMIDDDRAGKQIDRKLVNNILALYLEIGDKTGKIDAKYFAEKIIKENATSSFDEEASNWIATLSLTDDTPKLQELKLKSSKKIKLMSYDGDVFEVDYDVALMSKTLKDVIESYPNIEDSIPLSIKSTSSKILSKIIEYCKKHKEEFDDEEEYHLMMKNWDAEFIDLDPKTLGDLRASSNYLNIKSLRILELDKFFNMMKGKTMYETRQLFGLPDIYN